MYINHEVENWISTVGSTLVLTLLSELVTVIEISLYELTEIYPSYRDKYNQTMNCLFLQFMMNNADYLKEW